MSNSILLTGANGMIGSHLLFSLSLANMPVKAVIRKNADISTTEKIFHSYTENALDLLEKINWVEADITNLDDVLSITEENDTIIHSAAKMSFDPRDKKDMHKANVLATANIVDAALIKKVKKMCHISTIAFLNPFFENEPVDENLNRRASYTDSDYAKTKYKAEKEVHRGIATGLNAVIVNPSVVLGEGGENSALPRFYKMIQNNLRYYTSGITGFVDVRDVVRSILFLIENDFENERYIISSQNSSYKDIFNLIAQYSDRKPAEKLISHRLLKAVSLADSLLSRAKGKTPSLPKSAVKSAYNQTHYNSEKLRKILPFELITAEETIREYCRYRKSGQKIPFLS